MNTPVQASTSGRVSVRKRVLPLCMVASVTLFAACSSSNNDNEDTDGLIGFDATLSSENNVSGVIVADATGSVDFDIDTTGGALEGDVTVSGLSGTATAAHIHRGFAGQTGAVVLGLEGNEDGTVWSIPEGSVLTAEQLGWLTAGELYVNVHTEANASGEVRGQLLPPNVVMRRTELSGANEVPPVTTDASAVGFTTLNTATGDVVGVVLTSGLDQATAAHIHTGIAGENGDVLVGLVRPDAENPARWETEAGVNIDAATRAILEAGGHYYNVHTETNAGGEVRGQL